MVLAQDTTMWPPEPPPEAPPTRSKNEVFSPPLPVPPSAEMLPVGPTGRVAFEHSAGKLKDGLLALTAGEAASFTVSIGLIK